MQNAAIAFASGLSLVAATLAPSCGSATPAGIFKNQPYYGALSESRIDREVFGRLTKRFSGQPYRIVRRKLMLLGYRPVRFGPITEGEDQGCVLWGTDPNYEIISCATSIDARAFAFHLPRHTGYAVVIAYGETGPYVVNIRAATAEDLRLIRTKRQAAANYKPPFPVPFLVVPPCPPELCWNAGKD